MHRQCLLTEGLILMITQFDYFPWKMLFLFFTMLSVICLTPSPLQQLQDEIKTIHLDDDGWFAFVVHKETPLLTS